MTKYHGDDELNLLLVVPRLNIGGAETYVLTIALALKKLGFHVTVASGGGLLTGLLHDNGIQHFFVPIRLSTELASRRLKQIIQQNHINMIHANSAAAAITALKARQGLTYNVPVVYTAHGVFGHNAKEMLLNQCDRIICVSEYVRKYALKKGFSADKLVTLYTGIDLEKFNPDSKSVESIRKDFNIPIDAFTIAIVSRIKNLHNKGHADILRILETYHETHNWHLMVIGKGKGLWQLKYRIWKNNLQKRVHCLGHIVDVQNVLNGADVMVLPSNFETFGLVLAESMAMRKPVVTYAVGGTPEVVEHENTGFLVEKNNLNELHQRLRMLAESNELRIKMGNQGRNLVENRFDSKIMLDKLIGIYRNLSR